MQYSLKNILDKNQYFQEWKFGTGKISNLTMNERLRVVRTILQETLKVEIEKTRRRNFI